MDSSSKFLVLSINLPFYYNILVKKEIEFFSEANFNVAASGRFQGFLGGIDSEAMGL